MTNDQFTQFQSQLIASGLSAAAFCRQNNLAYHTYLYKKRKASQPSQNPDDNFPFLELVATDKGKPTSLAASTIQIEAFGIRIQCPLELSKSQWASIFAAAKQIASC